jgi:biotin carboxyl carrier protein
MQMGLEPRLPLVADEKESGAYVSPMPAQVLRVLVEVGETVAAGASLLVISSMKMENTIVANSAGIVSEIYVRPGQNIEAKAELLRIDPLVVSESAVTH